MTKIKGVKCTLSLKRDRDSPTAEFFTVVVKHLTERYGERGMGSKEDVGTMNKLRVLLGNAEHVFNELPSIPEEGGS